jgi:NAD(P)-dependent dehydrogenase (short-subunit alcohol dehydrogenase family)
MFALSGRTAIVTGSTKGIGRAIAEGFARAGASVVIVSRNQADCDAVAASLRELGADSVGVAADVTKLGDIETITRTALHRFGKIDILVNNAGGAITKRAVDITEEDWDRVVDLDLKSVFFCSQIVGRDMIRQNRGKIINIASVLGLVGEKLVLPYCAAKGGVIQMTRALALEWAKHNIQVNAVCPGYVLTAINAAEFENPKVFQHIVSKIPAGRLGETRDMVGAAIYLAASESDYMTGQVMTVDGGWTAQ